MRFWTCCVRLIVGVFSMVPCSLRISKPNIDSEGHYFLPNIGKNIGIYSILNRNNYYINSDDMYVFFGIISAGDET